MTQRECLDALHLSHFLQKMPTYALCWYVTAGTHRLCLCMITLLTLARLIFSGSASAHRSFQYRGANSTCRFEHYASSNEIEAAYLSRESYKYNLNNNRRSNGRNRLVQNHEGSPKRVTRAPLGP